MKVEDFSYKLEIYKNGQLVKTFDCPYALISPYVERLMYTSSPFTVKVILNSEIQITLPQST
jgi:hypothetical protein